MKKLLSLTVLVAALLPATAFATALTILTANADCLGWSADATIRFRAAVYEVDLDYTVVLADAEGNPIEVQNWTGTLTREMGSYPTQQFHFWGEWTVIAPPGKYDVTLTFQTRAPYGSGFEFSEKVQHAEFYCAVVPTENTSWTSIKSLYR